MNTRNTITGIRHETNVLGTVARLWRYPVKSMLGEQREFIDLDARGVKGDRLFAVRDDNGKFGSGKNTHRFRKIDGLFGFRAVYEGDVPTILFPDGRSMRGDAPDIHVALSNILGQPVTLNREAAISHLDASPVSLLTRASLAWLRSALPEVYADERRFRPNLLIDVPGATQVEHHWLGKTLSFGDAVRLRVIDLTERCMMVTFAQSDLPEDPRILRCITQEADLHFGVYAEVLVPGRIKRGDSVTVMNL